MLGGFQGSGYMCVSHIMPKSARDVRESLTRENIILEDSSDLPEWMRWIIQTGGKLVKFCQEIKVTIDKNHIFSS